ncbi:transcription termination factor Rho [Fodinicola acaciae]|uniref:transcription termination factor Rho n=1 Tax=Fodinicola acaciae TaxID=2681555 RepID=UPI003CCCCE9A
MTGMKLPELQTLASELGITGTARMRKSDLITAIKAKQGAAASQDTLLPVDDTPAAEAPRRRGRRVATRAAGSAAEAATSAEEPAASRTPAPRSAPAPRSSAAESAELPAAQPAAQSGETPAPTRRRGRPRRDEQAAAAATEPAVETPAEEQPRAAAPAATEPQQRQEGGGRNRERNDNRDRNDNRGDNRGDNNRGDRDNRGDRNRNQQNQGRGPQGQNNSSDDDEDGDGRRRPRRFRDRNRRGRDRGERFETNEPEIREDDVLIPVAGIVDVLDNYAFVRTSGYLTGPTDVYVSMSQVRRNGLRRGDHVTGAVRQPREGERRDKYNALVRLDTINGVPPEEARNRPEFTKLTPLYPQQRLRLETEPNLLTTRVIDLVMPIGKGQRALIVSPPKAGKTMVLQAIANAITTNNPECHLMVVLVDERPEEVTDMQRSVKGEVIASTFDRPPSDHTTVAELSIERAKRLVELGHDVVVLLDSITRLGRAYNLAAPASGRILSGGVDSTALYPPKRFLGAARNIENGGSLTILATALVETGSTMDTVIFEEFKGTGNAELKLDRKLSDKRIFPAVDVDASSTRKEEILLGPEELGIVIKLRRVLSALDSQQALELLLAQLKKTQTNVEFLMQIQKTTPGSFGSD